MAPSVMAEVPQGLRAHERTHVHYMNPQAKAGKYTCLIFIKQLTSLAAFLHSANLVRIIVHLLFRKIGPVLPRAFLAFYFSPSSYFLLAYIQDFYAVLFALSRCILVTWPRSPEHIIGEFACSRWTAAPL